MASILLADDNVDLLHMQKAVLMEAGHEVTTAMSGSEALKLTDRGAFDLVITDIVMPEGDGMETIVHFRKRFPETKIIAISGGGRIGVQNYLPVAEKLGADRTLAKPVSARVLLAVVDEVLAAA